MDEHRGEGMRKAPVYDQETVIRVWVEVYEREGMGNCRNKMSVISQKP